MEYDGTRYDTTGQGLAVGPRVSALATLHVVLVVACRALFGQGDLKCRKELQYVQGIGG